MKTRTREKAPPAVTADMLVLDEEIDVGEYGVRLCRPPEEPPPWEVDPTWPPAVIIDRNLRLVQIGEDPVDWRTGGLEAVPPSRFGRVRYWIADALNCPFEGFGDDIDEMLRMEIEDAYRKRHPDLPAGAFVDDDEVLREHFVIHMKGFFPDYGEGTKKWKQSDRVRAAEDYIEILEDVLKAQNEEACYFRVQEGNGSVTLGMFVLSDSWQAKVFGPDGEDRRKDWAFVRPIRDRFEDGEFARFLNKGQFSITVTDKVYGGVATSCWNCASPEEAAAFVSDWMEMASGGPSGTAASPNPDADHQEMTLS